MKQPHALVPSQTDCWIFLVLLSFVPLIGALYGVGNQVEQLSLIARLRDPGFAAGDFYIDAATGFGPRYYYAHLLAALSWTLPVPLVIHALSVASNFALAAVSFQAVQRLLGGSAVAGLLAATLVVVNQSFSLGFAGYLRFDSFQPASLAIPLALWGSFLHLTDRPYHAIALFAASALMHPLIGVEMALITYGAAAISVVLRRPVEGRLRPLARMTGAGLLFTAVIAAAYLRPMTTQSGPTLSAEDFFDILPAFRAPHHYLGLQFPMWSVKPFLAFLAATLALLGFGMTQRDRMPGVTALAAATAIVLAACAASLWFVDIAHDRIWATAQVFRMLLVVKWIGLLLLASVLAETLDREKAAGAVLTFCAVIAATDAQPRVMLLILTIAAGLYLIRDRQGPVWTALRWGTLAATLALSLLFTRQYGADIGWIRALVALAVLAPLLTFPARPAARALSILGLSAVLAATGLTRQAGLFGWPVLQADFSLDDLRDDASDAARAAGRVSPDGAVWVVPVDHEAFRLLSRRAVVVDFTSVPFDDASLADWKRRIDTLYGVVGGGGFSAERRINAAYRAGIDWDVARSAFGATHALLYADTPWSGPVLFENNSFKAVALPQ
ncbi:MAG: hypothetical protein KDA50_08005 [Rhodobacteraceae bacterium]|nr:hypothetical protein [Paracoccaceae bacterium]